MKKLKVMTVVGTRPEVIKLSRVIHALDTHCEHTLVHTGQNYAYELNQVFFDDLEIRKPDYFLEVAEVRVAAAVGNIIARVDTLFDTVMPEAMLIYGDTNSCLCAYPAKRRKIPVFHMEAGNRCFDDRVPEEINRRIIDHISDINMTLSEHARRYLIEEGIRAETIIKTGSSMREIYQYYAPKIDTSHILNTLNIKPYEYFLLSMHREENVDVEAHLRQLMDTMHSLVEQYQKKIIVSTHPRTRNRIEAFLEDNKEFTIHKDIAFIQAFGFSDYVQLQRNAFCLLSDSGSITEDASYLDIPAVNIRQAHERPEGVDVGAWVMSGVLPERILQAVALVTKQHHYGASKRQFNYVPDYDDPHLSKKIVRIIMSYVDYVNRTVWFKNNGMA